MPIRELLSDGAAATEGRVEVSRTTNRSTRAEVRLYRLGNVPRGNPQARLGTHPWLITCRSHSFATKAHGINEARQLMAAPYGWCDECHRIMLGELPKVGK